MIEQVWYDGASNKGFTPGGNFVWKLNIQNNEYAYTCNKYILCP